MPFLLVFALNEMFNSFFISDEASKFISTELKSRLIVVWFGNRKDLTWFQVRVSATRLQ